jgi:hypothetical protein
MRIAPELAWQMVDGEGVIVDLPRRRVLGLNPTGSLIFSMLERATEDEIAAEVAEGLAKAHAQGDDSTIVEW